MVRYAPAGGPATNGYPRPKPTCLPKEASNRLLTLDEASDKVLRHGDDGT